MTRRAAPQHYLLIDILSSKKNLSTWLIIPNPGWKHMKAVLSTEVTLDIMINVEVSYFQIFCQITIGKCGNEFKRKVIHQKENFKTHIFIFQLLKSEQSNGRNRTDKRSENSIWKYTMFLEYIFHLSKVTPTLRHRFRKLWKAEKNQSPAGLKFFFSNLWCGSVSFRWNQKNLNIKLRPQVEKNLQNVWNTNSFFNWCEKIGGWGGWRGVVSLWVFDMFTYHL